MSIKNKTKFVSILAIISAVTLSFMIPISHASNIPTKFYQGLDIDTLYSYNVSEFNTTEALQWLDFNWSTVGYANTTPSGQIRINFTGFYDKNPRDFFNLFESPMPYLDIEFLINESGSLILNSTFANVSNGLADMNLLIGYNTFKSGFLIPIDNFTYLAQKAIAQDQPPFMEASVDVKTTTNTITFEFIQNTTVPQSTTSKYDKRSGLLLSTNTSFGNYTLVMSLSNPPEIPQDAIPSYSAIIISIIGGFGFILIFFIINKKVVKK